MTRSSRVWLVLAVLFTLVNLAGAVMAVVYGELHHTAVHLGLLLLGAFLVGRIASTRIAPY